MNLASSRELHNLKTAIRLHLQLTGGPTPELCPYLLKIIDFLDMPPECPEVLAEVNTLASTILLGIAQGIQERYLNHRLEHSIYWIQDRLASPDAFLVLYHDTQLTLTTGDEPTCLPPLP